MYKYRHFHITFFVDNFQQYKQTTCQKLNKPVINVMPLPTQIKTDEDC
jgi:hypothetical protein